jgi:hypothetical protein
MLVSRYYEGLLRQHGRTPQALAERADDKDLDFYQHLFHGVELPERLFARAGLNGGRIYAQGLNLVTWTKFPGLDPEVQEAGNTWPQSLQFLAGVELRR